MAIPAGQHRGLLHYHFLQHHIPELQARQLARVLHGAEAESLGQCSGLRRDHVSAERVPGPGLQLGVQLRGEHRRGHGSLGPDAYRHCRRRRLAHVSDNDDSEWKLWSCWIYLMLGVRCAMEGGAPWKLAELGIVTALEIRRSVSSFRNVQQSLFDTSVRSYSVHVAKMNNEWRLIL